MDSGRIDRQHYRRILAEIADGIIFVDDRMIIHGANRAAARLLGTSNALGQTHLDHWLADGQGPIRGNPLPGRVCTVHGSQERVFVKTVDALDLPGLQCLIVAPLHTSRPDAIAAFAIRDPVTRLLNRAAFEETAGAAIGKAAAEQATLLFLSVRLDRFSLINETNGHDIGDDLLRATATRLREACPAETVAARLSGGHFCLLLRTAETGTDQAISQAIHQAMERPLSIGHLQRLATVSVGTAHWPADGQDLPSLMAAVESASNLAVAGGGGKTCAFNPAILQDVKDQLELEADLRMALPRGQLSLHYQPKIQWPSTRMVGMEALLRWHHPERGMVPPDRFIPLAEQNGMIIPIGRWVMDETCRQLAAWLDAGFVPPPIAVNVSPVQLMEQPLSEILAPLEQHGIPKRLVEIEITETAVMDLLQRSPGRLTDLREAGLRVAIDDFGTGHSSLSSLRKLPISLFKIDRSFVEDVGPSREARDIVSTIIAMAQALGLEVVAEGVETTEQAEFLFDHGASIMQGYLFSQPLTAAAIAAAWLPRRRAGRVKAPPAPCAVPSSAGPCRTAC